MRHQRWRHVCEEDTTPAPTSPLSRCHPGDRWQLPCLEVSGRGGGTKLEGMEGCRHVCVFGELCVPQPPGLEHCCGIHLQHPIAMCVGTVAAPSLDLPWLSREQVGKTPVMMLCPG